MCGGDNRGGGDLVHNLLVDTISLCYTQYTRIHHLAVHAGSVLYSTSSGSHCGRNRKWDAVGPFQKVGHIGELLQVGRTVAVIESETQWDSSRKKDTSDSHCKWAALWPSSKVRRSGTVPESRTHRIVTASGPHCGLHRKCDAVGPFQKVEHIG